MRACVNGAISNHAAVNSKKESPSGEARAPVMGGWGSLVAYRTRSPLQRPPRILSVN